MEVRCGAALQSRCGSVQAVTPPHLQWKLRANFRGKFLLLSLPASLPPSLFLSNAPSLSLTLSLFLPAFLSDRHKPNIMFETIVI